MKRVIFLILVSFILIIGVKMSIVHSQDKNYAGNKFEILIAIPWGEGSEEIQARFLDFPNFSFMSPEQQRQIYAPLRFKLDPQEGIHILNNDNRDIQAGEKIWITHFSSSGSWQGKTPIQENQSNTTNRIIIDFVVDQELNSYLLEKFNLNNIEHNRLTKLNVHGDVIWQKAGNFSTETINFKEMKGDFNKLLIDGQANLYLTSHNNPKVIAKIQPDSGNVARLYALTNGSSKIFINSKGDILNTVYFPEQNRRGLYTFNPDSGTEKTTVGNEELYGLLLYPLGIDNQLNCYVHQLADENNLPEIVKTSWEGKVINREIIKGLLVRSDDNTIFTHYIHNNKLEATGYYQDGKVKHWSWELPNKYSSYKTMNYQLIKVDEENKFYIFTGDQPGYSGTLVIFSEQGTLEQEINSPTNLLSLESSLQSSIYWQVDPEGRIYFPINDPLGFKVIRLNNL